MTTKISIQGRPASNSENAALRLYPDADIYHASSFTEAINALHRGEVGYCILPFGNALAGDVRETCRTETEYSEDDLLRPTKGEVFVVKEFLKDLAKYQMVMVEKYSHKIVHSLLATEGAEMEDIKTVYSHPMAFMQCSAYVDSKGFKQELFEDTAGAAKYIAQLNDKSVGAIADVKAAERHNLHILATAIADLEPNFTDFVVLKKDA